MLYTSLILGASIAAAHYAPRTYLVFMLVVAALSWRFVYAAKRARDNEQNEDDDHH